MKLFNARDLRRLLEPTACRQAMRDVMLEVAAGRFHAPVRSRVRPEGSENWVTLMPTLRLAGPRRWSLKEMVVTPANAGRGLDPLQGLVILHDGDDGRILALADAPALTALRTAATSALATEALARPQAGTVAVIGTGVQGEAHLRAMRELLPGAALRVWGRNAARTRALADEFGAEPFESIERAVRDADVVCTVTAAQDPILRREWIAPGCHINAVGSSTPAACEIEPALMAAAEVFVDRRDAALAEAGDVLRALAAGCLQPGDLRAELGEVLSGTQPGRRDAQAVTLYESLGFGALDLAALELALARSETMAIGTFVDWTA